MAVIELGLVTGDDDGRPPTAPWRPHPRLLIATVLVVCLCTISGSVPPRPHPFTELWSVAFRAETDSFVMLGDRVYVLSSDGGRRLTAYEQRTGTIRWTVAGLDDALWVNRAASGVLLLPTGNTTVEYDLGDGQTGIREFAPDLVAVDTATGRRLWRRSGEFLAAREGRALLVDWNEPGDAVRAARVIDLRDGTTVWSLSEPGPRTWVAVDDGDPDRVVVVRDGGRVSVHDLADGRLVADGRVPWPEATDYSTVLTVTGHTFHIHSAEGDLAGVSVHDTETLREKWHATSTGGGFYSCGTIMCGNQSNGITGYDRDTGTALWRLRGDGYATELTADRLLVELGTEEAERIMIDTRTGRQLADIGSGRLIAVRGTPGPWYLVNETADPPGRTSVAELDDRTGETLLRGSIGTAPGYACESIGDVLTCGGPQTLTVTDVGRVF
ncbi:PQQ-binding-like beta-propeller repeat protein [Actinoplanes sp. NPDC051494]|uniref:outer membrane protein assembly factor BamB family protein n=1 Tax=Actinoplanes sp. NPDC051494 TaxID=3363907 RepID=UPI0037A693E4